MTTIRTTILRLLLIFLLADLSACGLIGKTENETKAVQAVADFYGGVCEPFIGVSASTETGKKKFYELKLTESDALEQFKSSPEIAASNVAYIFYTQLREEKSNYSEIRSQLVFKDKGVYNSSFSSSDLELIQNKLSLLERLTGLLKKQDYKTISQMLSDETFSEKEKMTLVDDLRAADVELGEFKSYTILGFKKDSYRDFAVLDVFAVMDRSKEKIRLNVKIDLKPSEDKIHNINYKFEL